MRMIGSCARRAAIVAVGLGVAWPVGTSAQSACAGAPLAVQILGSGGPFPGSSRASSGYLVWRNGKAVVMIDAGGGTFARFGEAGARLQDLSLLAISHLHPDHVADLPALLWLSDQSRGRPLSVAGPSGAGAFPAFDAFLTRLFDGQSGAFPILAGTLGQTGAGARLDVRVVDVTAAAPQPVWSDSTLEVTAIGVPHGPVPTAAYRVRIGGRSLVFGSDQNGTDPRFAPFAAGADLLVMHLALSQTAPDPIARMHARPATVGEVAQAARAKRLVLSHLMQAPAPVTGQERFSLSDLDRAVAEVRKHFTGPVEAAADLECITM